MIVVNEKLQQRNRRNNAKYKRKCLDIEEKELQLQKILKEKRGSKTKKNRISREIR